MDPATRALYIAAQQGNEQELLTTAGSSFLLGAGSVVGAVIIVGILIGCYEAFAEWWEKKHEKHE